MHALKTLLTEMREPLLLPEILDSLTKLDKYSFTFRNRFVYVLFPFYDPAHNDRSTHAIVSLNGRFVKRYVHVYFYLTRTVHVHTVLVLYISKQICVGCIVSYMYIRLTFYMIYRWFTMYISRGLYVCVNIHVFTTTVTLMLHCIDILSVFLF